MERKNQALKKRQPGSVVEDSHESEYQMPVNYFRSMMACAAVAAGTIGCQTTPTQSVVDSAPAIQPLRATNRVYIAVPEDAVYKEETVPNSGRRTAIALNDAFQRQTRNIFLARTAEPLTEALAHARDNGSDHVVFATILKWEDHPTEWNAIRDRLVLKIDVIEAATANVVRSTTIENRSKFLTDGEDAPQDLLAGPVDKFVRSLYRITYTPSALRK